MTEKMAHMPSTSTAYTDLIKRQLAQPQYILNDQQREFCAAES